MPKIRFNLKYMKIRNRNHILLTFCFGANFFYNTLTQGKIGVFFDGLSEIKASCFIAINSSYHVLVDITFLCQNDQKGEKMLFHMLIIFLIQFFCRWSFKSKKKSIKSKNAVISSEKIIDTVESC